MELDTIACMDAQQFLSGIIDETVDLVVTSPPYNLRNSTGNGMKKDHKSLFWRGFTGGYGGVYDDDMPHDEYVCWQRNCLVEMMRVLKPTGAIFYNHKWRVQDGKLQNLPGEITEGLPVRQIIIWDRGGGMNFNDGYFLPTYEVIYLIAKPEYQLATGANKLKDVWRFPAVQNKQHPNSFPVQLPERCIRSSRCADVILDCFMGEGTTALAAQKLGRHYLGCDLNPEYVAIANKRLGQPYTPVLL